MDQQQRDGELGMFRRISRRDFLDGIAISVGTLGVAGVRAARSQSVSVPQDNPSYYPPALANMRGSHAGSFEVAHAVRDGKTFDTAADDKDSWDLVVVGG